jgi:ribonuclease HI/endonuclease/exonuclease/phosphatase family metal-dependent hydrolase
MPESPTPDDHTEDTDCLRFWQQNLNKSSDAQLDLLNNMHPKSTDIAIIQEPHINFLGNAQASAKWITVYPTGHRDRPARSRTLTMINRTTISSNAWTQLDVDHPDIVAVQIITAQGTLRVYNIYNDCTNDDTLTALDAHLRRVHNNRGLPRPIRRVWMGDFNRHSPVWDDDRNHHLFTRQNLKAADTLIRLAARYDMRMVLPPGIPTLEALASKNKTRVDNVFASSGTVRLFEICTTREDWRPVKTDHFPVISQINVAAERPAQTAKYDYREVDWEIFNRALETRLLTLPAPVPLRSKAEADHRLAELERTLKVVIDAQVPIVKPCPYVKRWWSKELAAQRKEVKRMAKKARRVDGIDGHPDIDKYRTARNEFADALRKAKNAHWVTWMNELDGHTIWDAHRLVKAEASDGGAARVPVLRVREQGSRRVKEEAVSNEDKARLFYKMSFPAKPLASSVPAGYVYPESIWEHEEVSDEQILDAINRLKPKKASKPGSISNTVLLQAGELLAPHLGPLFRATDTLKWYPVQWKTTSTVMIKKPGKTDYTVPGAWRPVVLSDGFARLLNRCKTNYLMDQCERHGVLQKNHFGGRPGRSTVDSIHLLVKVVKDAWRRGKVVTILFLDVKGAFPSVAIDRMVHELRAAGIPKAHADWMVRRLRGRKTTMSFDDFQSSEFGIDNGLDQGDPISGITYMIYNGGILECLDEKNGELGALFIDDAYLLTIGDTLVETHAKVKHIMEKSNGVFQWAADHNCEFGVDKFQLIDLTRRREPDPVNRGKTRPISRPSLILRGHQIESAPAATFLGVRIDRELRWREQGDAMVAKGQAWAAQIQRIARVKKGVPPSLLRRLYLAVAVPKIYYAADVCLSAGAPGKRVGGAGLIARLTTVQRKAALAITGAMRSTATDTLDAHANIMPVAVLIDKIRARAALRMATLPRSHPLFTHVKKAAARRVKRHPTPLHGLFHDFSISPATLETVDPVMADREWVPGFRTRVAASREAAILMDTDDVAPIQIYTDGSGKDGRIGAAAVLYRNGRKRRSLRYLLGSDKDHTVPEAEGIALVLGLELLRRERGVRRVSMAADNVGAIIRSATSKAAPMQYVWEIFRRRWETVKRQFRRMALTIRWVPGHEGVEGNEEADRQAKKAVEVGSSRAERLPASLRRPLPRSKQAAAREIEASLKERARKAWRESPRAQHMDEVDKSMPSRKYLELVEGLTRHKASLLMQMRTGHAPLQAHLFRLRKTESPTCPSCGRERETVQHYLMVCPEFQAQRRRMIADGGQGARNRGALLSQAKLRPLLFRYIVETGRFGQEWGADKKTRRERMEEIRRARGVRTHGR